MSEILVPVTQSTQPPQPNAGDWLLYWFDGDADYDDYDVYLRGGKKMVIRTGGGTQPVRALVIIAMHYTYKNRLLGKHDLDTPMLIVYGEGSSYELSRCRGLWEGPLLAPWQRKETSVENAIQQKL